MIFDAKDISFKFPSILEILFISMGNCSRKQYAKQKQSCATFVFLFLSVFGPYDHVVI